MEKLVNQKYATLSLSMPFRMTFVPMLDKFLVCGMGNSYKGSELFQIDPKLIWEPPQSFGIISVKQETG